MNPPKLALLALLTFALAVPCVWAQAEEETRFYALEHFPSDVLLYASVENLTQLKAGWRKTLVGRLAGHPGWVRALGGLWEKIEAKQKLAKLGLPFVKTTGKDLIELLSLPRGEISFAVRVLPGIPLPEFAFALELGETRSEILTVVSNLKEFVTEETGEAPKTREIAGVETTVWPGGLTGIYETRLADHLILVSTPGMLRDVVEAYRGARPDRRLKDSEFHRTLTARLGIPQAQFRLGVDLAALYRVVQGFVEEATDRDEIERVLEFLGADRLTVSGVTIGLRDDGLEYAAHVGTHEPRGLLESVLGAFGPLESSTEALSKIPSSAYQLGALRIEPGRLVRGWVGLVRKYFPEAEEEIQEAFRTIREATGIHVEQDLYALAPVELHGFAVAPPAGGLFPDQLVVLKTEAFDSYLAVVQKLAAAVQAETRTLPQPQQDPGTAVERSGSTVADGVANRSAPQVRYLALAGGKTVTGSVWEILADRGSAEPSLTTLLSLFLPTLAWTELPGGWTVTSTVPQAVVRYLSHYGREESIDNASPLGKLLVEQANNASGVSTFQSGKTLLWLYNSLLSAVSSVGSFLHGIGIDLGSVPPAEVFLDGIRPGFVKFTANPSGITIRGHRAHVVSAVGAFTVAAGLAWLAPGVIIGF